MFFFPSGRPFRPRPWRLKAGVQGRGTRRPGIKRIRGTRGRLFMPEARTLDAGRAGATPRESEALDQRAREARIRRASLRTWVLSPGR